MATYEGLKKLSDDLGMRMLSPEEVGDVLARISNPSPEQVRRANRLVFACRRSDIAARYKIRDDHPVVGAFVQLEENWVTVTTKVDRIGSIELAQKPCATSWIERSRRVK